jgi:hypothetical protein
MEYYNSKKLTLHKLYENIVKFIFSLEIATIVYNSYCGASTFCERVSEHKARELIDRFMSFDNVIIKHSGDHIVFSSSTAKITRVLKVYPRGYNGNGFLFKPERDKLRRVVKIFGSNGSNIFECRINGQNDNGKTKFFLGLGEYTEYSSNIYRYNVIDNNASIQDLKKLVSAKRKQGYKIAFSHCTESL